jgi:putative DNA primase/helicase
MDEPRDYCNEALAEAGIKPNGRSDGALIVHRAADIEIEPVEWLWPGRVAIGKQSLVAGEAGLGKSQVAIAIAAVVTVRGSWPCGEGCAPLGNVIILSAEDGAADTVVPRLMAAGAKLERIHIVSAVRAEDGRARRAFNLQADLSLLERKIAEIGDVRLVVIDPVSSYMGPKVDSHVNAAVRGVLEPVGEMAARLRVAVLCITHPPKGTGTTAINRFIGSIAFVAAARAAFMVTKDADDKDRRLFLPVKNNLAPLGKGLAFRLEQRIVGEPSKGIVGSSVAWESEPVTISADQALQATDGGGSDRSAAAEAGEFLLDKLSAGPVSAKEGEEHARALGIAPRTLARARKKLGVVAEKDGLRGGWMWRLPPEECQASPKAATSKIWHSSASLAAFEECQPPEGCQECQKGEIGSLREPGPAVAPPPAPADDPWHIPPELDRRRPERLGAPAISAGPDDDLGDIDLGWPR